MIAGYSSKALYDTIAYLDSDEARMSIDLDPYWPKWDSPWWRVTLLWELGLADRIPFRIIQEIARKVHSDCLHYFPLREEDIPLGIDPYRQIICHCAVGTIMQVFDASGAVIDDELPWSRDYLMKNQLPDGGLNCDEQAYSKNPPKSSLVSTLPALEAILHTTHRSFTLEELNFLDSGANYILNHKLMRKLSGELIDESWSRLCFPRFYFYDILRGLSFLVEYAEICSRSLPYNAMSEVILLLEKSLETGVEIGRSVVHSKEFTLRWNGVAWKGGGDAKTFPLLDEVSRIGSRSSFLTNSLNQTFEGLKRLQRNGFLTIAEQNATLSS
jgi:hypothetical protein